MGAPEGVDAYIIPHSLRSLYAIPETETAAGTSQCIIEFDGVTAFNNQDMRMFFTQTMTPHQQFIHFIGPFNNLTEDTIR